MGGQAGSRGYIYQGIVAILESLVNNEWDKIYVEYISKDEKVDIALLKDSRLIKAIQVKSSINQFTKNNIITWIDALIHDEDADDYQLHLIGNCEKDAEIFIRSIEKYYKSYDGTLDDKARKSLGDYKDVLSKYNVTIKLYNNDEDALLAYVRDTLNRYIFYRGCFVTQDTLSILAYALTFEMMLLGTKGNYEERGKYEERIFSWLKQTCNGDIHSINKYSSHKIFNCVNESLIEEIKPVKFEDLPGFINYKDDLLIQGKQLIKKIAAIKLPRYIENEKDSYNNSNIDMQLIDKNSDLNFIPLFNKNIKNLFEFHSAEMNNKRKDELKEDIRKYWTIDIEDDFFYVGNLLVKHNLNSSSEYKGTAEEKYKADLLSDLEVLIIKLDILDALQYIFEDKYFLILCLKNISTYPDSNITINIKIVDDNSRFFNIQYESEDNKELLGALANELLINNEDLIRTLLQPKNNDSVTIEKSNRIPLRTQKFSFNGRVKYDFNDLCDVITDYIAQENNGQVNYSFSSLRAGEAKWLFPWIVISNIRSTCTLHYKILSNNTDGNCEGDISVQL